MMAVWLIGAGSMARDYANVLKSLNVDFKVVGRGISSAKAFEADTDVGVSVGGVSASLASEKAPEKAIVAVGVEQLAIATEQLIMAGTKTIMVEKPAGLHREEIGALNKLACEHGAEVFIAYNRRFYNSVLEARKLIELDGGVLSAHFEFTEWSHVIASLNKGKGVKDHWLLGNSSHVIDLAFHLIGRPLDWKCWHSGKVDWHPTSARFAGAGVTEQNVMFSYIADWEAPGRWGLEVMTANRRLVLKPLEKLQAMELGSVKLDVVENLDSLDEKYKPGLYRQTKAFLLGDLDNFCTLSEQLENVQTYSVMAGYL